MTHSDTNMSETYRGAYDRGQKELAAAGVAEAALDAKLLLEHVCHTGRSVLYADPERSLTAAEKEAYQALITRRAARVPVAHLTGEQEFMGLFFHTARDVLLPRQDTETLVEEALRHLFDGMRILDLCTGSGCVALSLLRYSNDTLATGTDISGEAIGLAEKNASRLGLSGRFEAVRCDLFPPLAPAAEKRYDLIVANPPYIPSAQISELQPEVRDHDPHKALDGGADGLMFYRRITETAPAYLSRGGRMFLEIGFDQKEAVEEMLHAAGYEEIRTVRDAGGLDRVVSCSFREHGHV